MAEIEDRQSPLKLQKVAFVAMPFGIKTTGNSEGGGPIHVDFDALWEKAIQPALSARKYLAIRADNQTGSVIIKDMLEQLVHADLVLADISIPNGNVYYEAGVRHAARETGCILICAEWAKPLFDLAQITHIRYPFPSREPKDRDYQLVREELESKIPGLVESTGPVFTLTEFDPEEPQDSRKLKEVFSGVFEFQNHLTVARLAAADNQKSELRGLVNSPIVKHLPGYALRELVVAVRDHLSWGELFNLIHAMPDGALKDPFFLEQKANALAKQGRYHKAIALLHSIIQKHGPTPERWGTLGGRYRELADEEPNRTKKRQYLAAAIDAYRKGMGLDLNEFYCAQKLLVTLVERRREEDLKEAERCAVTARFAARRAEELNPEEEWVDGALAVIAFFYQDAGGARKQIDAILDKGWPNWKLVGLVRDLESVLTGIEEQKQEPFRELISEMTESLPVAQLRLMEDVLPMIRDASQKYRKFQQIHARPAKAGEVIVSTTSDGEETTKTAKDDEYVVKNLTEAQEEYLVGEKKFNERYTFVEDVDDEWKLYDSVGEVLALEISRAITTMLGVGEEFYIEAPWKSDQLVREGDMFVSPFSTLDEVYRIARKEFDETYRPA
jgi:hypothetical protein